MEIFDKSINTISSQAISMKREIYDLFKNKKEIVDSINNYLEFKLKEYNNAKFQLKRNIHYMKRRLLK